MKHHLYNTFRGAIDIFAILLALSAPFGVGVILFWALSKSLWGLVALMALFFFLIFAWFVGKSPTRIVHFKSDDEEW